MNRALILAALPGTSRSLTERTGVAMMTVYRWVTIFRREGLLHIGGWRRCGKNFSPYYVAGPGNDVECSLKPITVAQSCERYRKAIQGTEKEDRIRARKNARRWIEKAKANRDPMIAALFGPAISLVTAS